MSIRQSIIAILNKRLTKWNEESIDELYKELSDSVSEHLYLLNSEKKLEWVPFKEIRFTYREDGKYSIFVTKNGEYRHIIPHETLLEILEGKSFQLVDNKVFVNLKLITKFDTNLNRIYFDYDISKDSQYREASVNGMKKISEILGAEGDMAKAIKNTAVQIETKKKTLFGFL